MLVRPRRLKNTQGQDGHRGLSRKLEVSGLRGFEFFFELDLELGQLLLDAGVRLVVLDFADAVVRPVNGRGQGVTKPDGRLLVLPARLLQFLVEVPLGPLEHVVEPLLLRKGELRLIIHSRWRNLI